MATRRLGRPRTKVYDLNYNLGESYYRGALEGLDRKYGRAPTETIEPPKRPQSVGDFESILKREKSATPQRSSIINVLEEDQALLNTLARIQRARKVAASASAEAEFENTFFNRTEQVKNNFSEKMLDAVGLNHTIVEEESRKRRQKQIDALEESTPKITEKWIALRDAAQDSVDEAQARARARASKARITDLENEMDALVERSAARERRLADIRSVLNSEASLKASESSSSSTATRLRKKITVTQTTEKRSIK